MIVIGRSSTDFRRDEVTLAGFGHMGWEWHPFAAEKQLVDAWHIARRPPQTACRKTIRLFLPRSLDVGAYKISRATYADMYGPTTGDKVRLADTELFIEVEKDFTIYGEEVKFGGGKVIRDGMGQSQATRAEGAVDTVITNALIVDHTGIYKADVGLKDGRIAAHRQGRQSGYAAGRHHHHRPLDRGDRRRRQDPDRRRHRRAYPLHLPAADRGGADERRHHHAGRRHRPGARHAGHHLHPAPGISSG